MAIRTIMSVLNVDNEKYNARLCVHDISGKEMGLKARNRVCS